MPFASAAALLATRNSTQKRKRLSLSCNLRGACPSRGRRTPPSPRRRVKLSDRSILAVPPARKRHAKMGSPLRPPAFVFFLIWAIHVRLATASGRKPLIELPCFAEKLALNATATSLYCKNEYIAHGVLPDELAVLSMLTSIDLSNTRDEGGLLSGSLPPWFGPSSFPNLKKLDISGNLFTGTIPSALGDLVALTSTASGDG